MISKHLEKLVFISDEKGIGFYEKGNLITVFGEEIPLKETNTLRIAHCVDLHEQNVWTEFQSYCFDQKLKTAIQADFQRIICSNARRIARKINFQTLCGTSSTAKTDIGVAKNPRLESRL